MSEKSIIVIGAGVAGLAAACYGQMNGYGVRIFEQDARPGGLCTSWERKGFTINAGLAFLIGSGPGTNFFRVWKELGVVPKIRMIDSEYFVIVEGKKGEKFLMYSDVDCLERHMRELAPEDEKAIDEFIQAVRIFSRYPLPIGKAPELQTAFDKMKLLLNRFPLIRTLGKWKNVSIRDFADRFKNPFLREALFQSKALFSDDLPVMLIHLIVAGGHLKSAGYPEGGGLVFSQAIEKRFRDLGGTVEYQSCVDKILVENNKAVGIRLENGSKHYADSVISAADGRTTIFHMLDGKYVDDKIRGCYDSFPLCNPVIIVALGVSRRFENLPHSAAGIIYPLKEPVDIGGLKIERLRPMIYNFDPTLAPIGKTLIRIVLPADYDYWRGLRNHHGRYDEEKVKVAETVIRLLEQRFPGISSDVEMQDVATPLTFERYTGNWKGSIIGWDLTTKTVFRPLPKTLPGLENFWMAGQWVEPGGGIPFVALSGRNVIQLIARRDKKPFVTSVSKS